MNGIHRIVPGLLLVAAISSLACWLGKLFPIVGGPVIAIIIGIAVGNLWNKPQSALPGIKFISRKVLQWAIIFQGTGLSLQQIWRTGSSSLYLMLFTFAAAFLSTYLLGKWLRIPSRLNLLIGVGTAICGGSAIAAVSPVIRAEDEEIAYAVTTIFLFNIVAVLAFPTIGHLLNLSDHAFGLWAGTAINDTSSVVAAGYTYSNAAGDYATVVKLTRSTMIIPVAVVLAIWFGRKSKRETNADLAGKVHFAAIFPWFILGFIAASFLNTVGWISGDMVSQLHGIGNFMIVMAIAAIGLSANFQKMFSVSLKPIGLGLCVWLALLMTSLAFILLT